MKLVDAIRLNSPAQHTNKSTPQLGANEVDDSDKKINLNPEKTEDYNKSKQMEHMNARLEKNRKDIEKMHK